MSPVELVALSLGVSIVVAAIAGLAAAGLERLSADPGLRERVWALALYLPVLPPVLVGGLLLTPAPVRPVLVLPVQTEVIQTAPVAVTDVVPVANNFSPDWALVALVVLAIAAGLIAVRGLSLTWRAARLRRLVSRATPASEPACHAVAETARSLGVAAPSVRATTSGSDALLTGLTRPVLILPDALALTPESPAARAVITHELAHLKRGDHRAVWLEEAVLALLAVNPVLPLIRARRAAAREEACDALALTGAELHARRAYAQSLIEALRARTDPMLAVPALTFTGTPRSQAMRRLKSILTPPATAGRGVRVATLIAGLGLIGAVGLAGVAIASQREAVLLASDPGDPGDAALRRLAEADAADFRLYCAADETTLDRGQCSFVLFDAALEESRKSSPAFCAPPQNDAGLTAIRERGRAQVLVNTDVQGSAQDSARRALTAAFPCEGEARQPSATELAAVEGGLKAEWSAVHAARAATEAAQRAANLQAETGSVMKAKCLGQGVEKAGCDGVIFGFTIRENMKPATDRTFCAPESSDDAKVLIDRMEREIAQTPVQTSESGRAYLSRVLRSAYPCQVASVSGPNEAGIAARAAAVASAQANGTAPVAGSTRLTVKVGQDQTPFIIGQGFSLAVSMTGETGEGVRSIATTMPLTRETSIGRLVFFDLDANAFPRQMPGYSYTLKAEIKNAEGRVFYASDPTVLRLAPSSQRQLATLRPELTLKKTAVAAP